MLSDGDRQWLEQRFKEGRDESTRQWNFVSKLNTELAVHVANSNAVHANPCVTAQVLLKAHEDGKHNVKKTMTIVGLILGAAASIGEAIHYLREYLGSGTKGH